MRKLTISTLMVACAALASTLGQAQATQAGKDAIKPPVERLCAGTSNQAEHEHYAKRLAERLKLTDAQKAAFKTFQDARIKSLADAKAVLCAKQPDLSSFESRLVFSQTFLEARLEALKAENPLLIAFYKSLDPQQQAEFDEMRADRTASDGGNGHGRSPHRRHHHHHHRHHQ